MTPELRRSGLFSAGLHLAILLALILALPQRRQLGNLDEGAISMEFEVLPQPVQRAPNPAPMPAPAPAQVATPDLPSIDLPRPALLVPPPPPPPPPQPSVASPAAPPSPALPTPPPPPTAIARPAPVTLAPAPLATAASRPTPAAAAPLPTPPRPAPPQPAVTAQVPPATPAPRPTPQHTQVPAPSNSNTSQPNQNRNTVAESRTLEATLERLRSLQRQTEPPRAVYNPPRGGAPGGGQPTGVDNAQLNSAVRGAIGDRLRECYEQDTGARDYDKQSVRLRVTTDETGTIRMAELAPNERGRVGVARAFAERAVRTVLNARCATLPLPRSMLGTTHTFEITFKP